MSPALRHTTLAAVLACGLLLASNSANAVDRPLWELGLGVAGLRIPTYRGSAQSHNWLLPAPYVVYRGRIFRADRDGLRARLFDTDKVDLDISVAGSAPTKSGDSDARRGMADLRPTFEIGPQLNVNLVRQPGWKLDLRLPVRAAITLENRPQGVGWIATPHLNVDLIGVGGWNVGVQAGPIFSSQRQHAYFYEVSAADATASRPAYHASGGYAGMKALTGISRRFDNTWVGAFVRYDNLSGARFVDSPLVTQRQQWAAGIAVSWVFATSERRVASPE